MTQKEMLINVLLEIYEISDEAEFVADYLVKSGVIMPPCKIGDTVYCINQCSMIEPRITVCKVDALHITSGKNQLGHKKPSYALVRNKNMKSLSSRIYFDDFDKTAFCTKEGAEERIQVLKGGAK